MTQATTASATAIASPAVPAVPAIRILKIATCPSLSGKSQLTYHLGCTPDAEVQLRIYANTAAGAFNADWVSVSGMQQALAKAPLPGKLTSYALKSLFQGKSINTPPFLFAALLNEELVRPSTTTKRCYEATDGKKFSAQVKALVGSKVDLTDKVPKVEKAPKAEKAPKEPKAPKPQVAQPVPKAQPVEKKEKASKPPKEQEAPKAPQVGATGKNGQDAPKTEVPPVGTASKTRRAATTGTKEQAKAQAKAKPGSVVAGRKAAGKAKSATA